MASTRPVFRSFASTNMAKRLQEQVEAETERATAELSTSAAKFLPQIDTIS